VTAADALTLLRVISLLTGLAVIAWTGIGLPMRIAPGAALRFAVGNLLIMVSVLLTMQRGPEPSYVFYPGADMAGLLAFTLMRTGIQKLGRQAITLSESVSVLVLAGLAEFTLPPVAESTNAASVIYSLAAAWISLRAFREAALALRAELGWVAVITIAWPFAVLGGMMLIRAFLSLGSGGFPVVAAEIRSSGAVPLLWVFIVLTMALNFSLVGMAFSRLMGRIRAMAERDGLTGVWNRRAIETRIRGEAERFRRSGKTYALVMFDLDHFKAVNDQLGHAGGDAALCHTVSIIGATLRHLDALGRFGGEEFLVLLPNADIAGGFGAAERMRAALQANPMIWAGNPVPITASFGFAVAGAGDNAQDMLKRADEALYRAKASGRNRVEAAVEKST
jgi:diguanylate cyclase (GGDEF)-like protein